MLEAGVRVEGGNKGEKGGFKRFREKMGSITEAETEKLIISEFNTRCRFVDEDQVQRLMTSMNENGFIPRCAVWVNAITEDGTAKGKILQYRLVAGRHRHEAATRIGLEKIPCQFFYNVEPEDECELDRLDNELDESHKPINFLEESEHCKYLYEVKKWSYRKIARTKGVDHASIIRKIKIANLSEEAKEIIRGGGDPGHHLFSEKYFRDICKLSEPHIIAICHEIADRGKQAARGEVDKGRAIHPMRQADIKTRVEELLNLEKKGKVVRKERVLIPAQAELDLFPDEEEDEEADEPEEERYETRTVIAEVEREERPAPEVTPVPCAEPIPQLNPKLAHRDPEKITHNMNFDRCVRWFKLLGLLKEKGGAYHIVLKKLIEYDLWYQSKNDEPFYFSEKEYEDPIDLLAEEAGVGRDQILKRTLPTLNKEGLIEYWMTKGGQYQFKLNWDALFELYCKKAYAIPQKEDGLKGLQADFTGTIRPTPFHYLRIENGKVLPWNGSPVKESAGAPARNTAKSVRPDEQLPQKFKEDESSIAWALKSLLPAMDEKAIIFCLSKKNETETALKLLQEMAPEKKREIKNEAGYILELVRRGPQIPQGFVTPQEARELEEKKKQKAAFFKMFNAANCTRFVRGGKEYELTLVDGDHHGFLIQKEDEQTYARFDDWLDMKYFK